MFNEFIVEKQQRDAAFEHGSKCVDFLATWGVIRCAAGTELMECDEIDDSDHRDYLIDAVIADYFSE